MDPVAHTFTGAALAAAGLRRATPLATAALLIGANIPDVDVLSYFADEFKAVAFRRGWTHGVLALALWPFVVTGALLLWDRWVRRRRNAAAAPARAGPLLAVAALAVDLASDARLVQQLWAALADAVRRPLVLRGCAIRHRSVGRTSCSAEFCS